MTTMRTKIIAFLPAVILLGFWTAGSFIAGQQVPAPAVQAQTFDHSQCQYPDRTTNPPDGCDNSDPCDPASAVKGGSGDCVEAPTKAEAPAPATTVEPAPETTGKGGGQCSE